MGGTGIQTSAGAGGMVIYYSSGSMNYNSHVLTGLTLTSCSGGTGIRTGAGAGGVAIWYYSAGGNSVDMNSHTISNLYASHCRGGDSSQGAGALAVVVARGSPVGFSTILSGSNFFQNQGGVADGQSQGVGVAGVVRFHIPQNKTGNNNFRIWDTRFESNSLSSDCTSVLCLAGAVALSGAAATIGMCSFDNNSSPALSGALFVQRGHLALESSVFRDNKAGATYSVASIESLTVQSTEMYFNQTAVTGVHLRSQPEFNLTKSGNSSFANSSRHVLPFGLLLGCPAGAQVYTPVANQFKCQTCASGQYSLSAGEFVDNVVQTNCSSCPDGDPSKVVCSSNSVVAQPGQFVYYSGSKTVATVACINQLAACNRLDAINSTCDTDLFTCNNAPGKCTDGYTGMLCASCDSGWYAPKLDALSCNTCPNKGASITVDPLLSVVLYIFAVALDTYEAQCQLRRECSG